MSDGGELKSLASCVSFILGVRDEDVPDESELQLRQWLSGRNYGIVHTTPTNGFTWPGYFLARRGAGTWTVLFGAPPGMVYDPEGGELAFGSLEDTFDSLAFLAPYQFSGNRSPYTTRTERGTVRYIALAKAAEAPMREVERAEALAGRGLKGDRYEQKAGTFTDTKGKGNDLTLVESEALEELRGGGVEVDFLKARRNIVTGGVKLDALIGRRFRIGTVECFGQRRCEPCIHLERLTKPGVLAGLVYRGGLRADVVSDGIISIGDEVRLVD